MTSLSDFLSDSDSGFDIYGFRREDVMPLLAKIGVRHQADSACIGGATFAKLSAALTAFPDKYPDYRSRPPKLDDDVRPWLKDIFDCNVREAHVFSSIIQEHYGLT